ncbi:DEAD/DEAH box helicase [Streptomyces sp. NPDC002248]
MTKYKWKTRPYYHQVAAVKKLLSTGWGGALLMAPRTGKTKTLIDYASIMHLKGEVSRVLIFCPVSVIGVWEQEIAAHCPFKYRITVWDRKGRKKQNLPRLGDDVLDFVILNYDALSTPGAVIEVDEYGGKRRSKSRGGRYTILKALRRWQPHLIALDESHRIKTPSAKKSTALHSLGKVAPYRVIMTGTVVTKKKRIFDVYSQWKFLNPGRFSDYTFALFKSEFGVFRQRDGWSQWVGNKNEDTLHEQMHKDAFAIERSECFDLPERTVQIIPVELEESGSHYDQMAEEMVTQVKSGEYAEAPIKLVQTLRLRQITSGIVKTAPSIEYPEGRLVRLGHEKLDTMREILSDLFEADEKVVVGAHFVGDIDAIHKICQELKVKSFVLRGGVPRLQRDKDLQAFRKMNGPACFIAQPQAASLGIDLSTASICIWFSLTPSYVDYTQFEDRIALSDRPTTYMYLLARDTVDELLYETLQEDGDIAKAIMMSPERILRSSEDHRE